MLGRERDEGLFCPIEILLRREESVGTRHMFGQCADIPAGSEYSPEQILLVPVQKREDRDRRPELWRPDKDDLVHQGSLTRLVESVQEFLGDESPVGMCDDSDLARFGRLCESLRLGK